MAAMLVNGRLFGLAAMLANPHCFAVKTDKKNQGNASGL